MFSFIVLITYEFIELFTLEQLVINTARTLFFLH